MAWSTPGTASAGAVLTSATWNQDVRDNSAFLYGPPRCRIYHTSDQTVNPTLGTVLFNSERFDTDTMHDTDSESGRITFTTAGVYAVGFHGRIDEATTGYMQSAIRYNNTTEIATHRWEVTDESNIDDIFSYSTMYEFSANDYVTFSVYGGGASELLVAQGNYSPEAWAFWVGGPTS